MERTRSVRPDRRTARLHMLTGRRDGSAAETSLCSGAVKSGVSSTAVVKRIVGRHIKNLKEAIEPEEVRI